MKVFLMRTDPSSKPSLEVCLPARAGGGPMGAGLLERPSAVLGAALAQRGTRRTTAPEALLPPKQPARGEVRGHCNASGLAFGTCRRGCDGSPTVPGGSPEFQIAWSVVWPTAPLKPTDGRARAP
mmetsp:Transcript_78259/g.211724  ORF Transcript_78259/g.211724 Transcript_78259/m.211724 type:complete len:125 (-) Transcript_78259:155-529(-)